MTNTIESNFIVYVFQTISSQTGDVLWGRRLYFYYLSRAAFG